MMNPAIEAPIPNTRPIIPIANREAMVNVTASEKPMNQIDNNYEHKEFLGNYLNLFSVSTCKM